MTAHSTSMRKKTFSKILFPAFIGILLLITPFEVSAQDAIGLIPPSPTITITPSTTPFDTSGLTLYTSSPSYTNTPSNITVTDTPSITSNNSLSINSLSPVGSISISPSPIQFNSNSSSLLILGTGNSINGSTSTFTVGSNVGIETTSPTYYPTVPNYSLNPPFFSPTPKAVRIILPTKSTGSYCTQVLTAAINSSTGECQVYSTPCAVPPGWKSLASSQCPTVINPTSTPTPTAALTPTPTSTPVPTSTPTPSFTINPTSTPSPAPTNTNNPTSNSSPTPTEVVDSSSVITYPRIQTFPQPTPFPEAYDTKVVTQNISILNMYLPILSWLGHPTLYPLNLSNTYTSPSTVSPLSTYIGTTNYSTATLLPLTNPLLINK